MFSFKTVVINLLPPTLLISNEFISSKSATLGPGLVLVLEQIWHRCPVLMKL